MAHVKPVPSMVWTRRSAAISMLVALEEHRREIGQRLVAFREAKGLTQDELSHQAGIAEKTVSRLENGRHEPELDTLRKLAKALEIEVMDLQGERPTPLGLGETQLDRIEAKLDRVLKLLDESADPPADPPVDPGKVVAGIVSRAEETAASTRKKAPGRKQNPPAAQQRKPA